MTGVVILKVNPIASFAARRIQRQARRTAIVRIKRRFNMVF